MSKPERFDHPVLAQLYTTIETIEQAESLLKQAKELLPKLVEALPTQIGSNEDLQDAIFHHLYWFDERVPANTLKQTFQRWPASQTRKRYSNRAIRNARLEVTCSQCKQSYYIEFESRSRLNDTRERIARGFFSGQCQECQEKSTLKSTEAFQQWQSEKQQRLNFLHTMPYLDYLQTPEWQERRQRAMKKAGFRCQVCNAYGVRLNVHHRTYERRGYEYDNDLITLCQGCHQIFHDNGSLAIDE